MKKIVLMAFALAGLMAQAAATGSCESKAASIGVGATKTVKLVDAWDPDSKEYMDMGVYYFKATLSKGNAYTLWSDSGSCSVSAAWATDAQYEKGISEPMADFNDSAEQAGKYVSWMYEDDWDSEDPDKWTYYICVEGDIGDSVTVSLQGGIVTFLTEGVEGNPVKLTMKDSQQSVSGKKITDENEFWFTAALAANRKYLVGTTGGTAVAPLSLNVTSDDAEFSLVAQNVADSNNTSWAILTTAGGTGSFTVYGEEGQSFGLTYRSVPSRTPAAHPTKDLAAGTPVSFQPGRLVGNDQYYDQVIDDNLYRIAVKKGDRLVFDARGADRDVEMRVYDADGDYAVNTTVGMDSKDVRVAAEAAADGYLYVGVMNPELGVTNALVGASVTLVAEKVAADDGDTVVAVSPAPGSEEDDPVEVGEEYGPYPLDRGHWSKSFAFGGRKGITYALATDLELGGWTDLHLVATVYRISGSSKSLVGTYDITPGADPVPVTGANAQYLVNVSVKEGKALEYPDFKFYALAYSDSEEPLGILTVNLKGADGQWTLDKETTKYESGVSLLLSGTHTVKFTTVSGFKVLPASTNVTVKAGSEPTVVTGVYNDTYDPKDDDYSGATALKLSSKATLASRTLWKEDACDWFAFTAKDGVYYDFELDKDPVANDGVMYVYAKTSSKKPSADPVSLVTAGVTEIRQLQLAKGDYYLCVKHAAQDQANWKDGAYVLSATAANVGTISFAKTAVSAKKSAGSVTLTVNRSSGEGKVRVLYGTVNLSGQVVDPALPGKDYVAQCGELVWEDGDKKAKTIEIKLIPELFAEKAVSRPFNVQLKAVDAEELGDDEYPAALAAGKDVAVVTVTEAQGKTTTVKAATTKTEEVELEIGSYQGVIAEDGSALTNGFPALASVTFTAKDATKKALSAKVILGGKTYSFAADAWDEDETDNDTAVAVMTLSQKVNGVNYENTLRVSVKRCVRAASAWLEASAKVELTMNVPDANGKGVQEEIAYAGELFRDNAKIQEYLDAVKDAVGYYTVALVPSGVSAADGVPAGNGYLTLTLDNKGKAKVAGLLSDGSTKPSYSSIVAVRDSGKTLLVPVFVAKSPYCFGGTLKLVRGADGKYVVDSSEALVWNNDNALLTYDSEAGWSLALDPVGGYFNTVNNLQTYYLTREISVSTVGTEDFLGEACADGYEYVAGVGPNGTPAAYAGNTLSTSKRTLVKDGKLVDFEASVNPCNVQVKLTRATGLVTGTFSLWTKKEDGTQKEMTGLKHNGILLLSRDESAVLDSEVMSAGFFTQTATLGYTDEKGKAKTRKYTASMPFNILAVDQGEPDWYADDWGEQPLE